MELREWLVFLHILGSVIWVGGTIVTTALMARASRAHDRTVILRLTDEIEWVGRRLVGPSVFVVVGVGVWLVPITEEWHLTQLWIWLSLVLVAVSTFLGIYSGAEGAEIPRLADELGAEHHEVRGRSSRLLWLAGLDTLILLVIVWLMVFKPGV